MNNIFSTRLKLLRKEHDISAEELSAKLDINKSTISRYETGKTEPNLPIVIKIANYFNVSIDWLAGLTEIRNWSNLSCSNIVTNYNNLSIEKKQELIRYSIFLQKDIH